MPNMHNAHFAVASNECNPPKTRWQIHVYCPGCSYRKSYFTRRGPNEEGLRGGCILCYSLVERMDAVVHRPEWHAFRRAMCKDRSVAMIAADWLDDNGLPEAAEQLRVDWSRKDISEKTSDAAALNDLPF